MKPDWADEVLQNLKGCQQDPVWHREGTADVHTQMVVDQLQAMENYHLLPVSDQEILLKAAYLHDIAKPTCAKFESGKIRHFGHAKRGAIMARRFLYEKGEDPFVREEICGLVRWHMVPVNLLEAEEAQIHKKLIRASFSCRMDLLRILSEADNKGRIGDTESSDMSRELFWDYVKQLKLTKNVWPYSFEFPSIHTKVAYFLSENRSPFFEIYPDERFPLGSLIKFEMVLLAGLPGSGKDSYVQTNTHVTKSFFNHEVVSLDDIRDELEIESGKNQSEVVSLAKNRIKALLGKGRSLVFNATNLVRELRAYWLKLAYDYHAKIKIIYLEVPYKELVRRNLNRPIGDRLPEAALNRLMDRWDVPDASECHALVRSYWNPS